MGYTSYTSPRRIPKVLVMFTHLVPLLLVLFQVPSVPAVENEECQRFCPEDLHASVIAHRFMDRVIFLQKTLTAAVDGLELLQEKTSTMPDDMRERAGLSSQEASSIDLEKLRDIQADLFNHMIRADKRAWNRVIDTYNDMVDKSRAPKAPKDLPDLRFEIENLHKAAKETEESFEPFLEVLGGHLASMYYSLIVVVEGMVKAGGKEVVLKMMQQKVDNLMGNVLLQLVENRIEDTKTVVPSLLGDITKLAEKLAYDFYALGLKVKQVEFWKMELKTLEDYLAHIAVPEDEVDKDVKFIVALIERYKK